MPYLLTLENSYNEKRHFGIFRQEAEVYEIEIFRGCP